MAASDDVIVRRTLRKFVHVLLTRARPSLLMPFLTMKVSSHFDALFPMFQSSPINAALLMAGGKVGSQGITHHRRGGPTTHLASHPRCCN
jgi:hypothetical protein